MSTDKDHLALPHLYGAPAHSARRMATGGVDLPAVGPDDLPIETSRSVEDQALALQLFPRSYSAQAIEAGPRPVRQPAYSSRRAPQLRARPFVLRALAGRLMRPKGH